MHNTRETRIRTRQHTTQQSREEATGYGITEEQEEIRT